MWAWSQTSSRFCSHSVTEGSSVGSPDHGKRGGGSPRFEGGDSCSGFDQGILGVLGPEQISTPLCLLLLAVGTEKANYVLVQTFRLAVGLGMIAGGEADINVKMLEEGNPHSRGELRTLCRRVDHRTGIHGCRGVTLFRRKWEA